MKRFALIVLATLLCISTFAGCKKDGAKFDFSIELEKSVYLRGEIINVTASVTNISGKTFRYMGCSGNDFIPSIELYTSVGDSGDKSYLSFEPIAFPEDVVRKKVRNGESGSIVYSFKIPEDAKLGAYSAVLYKGEDSKEFSDVLTIVETSSQNKSEKYQYSSAIIRSGEGCINPIRTLNHTTEYTLDGEPGLHGDGFGAHAFFDNDENPPSCLPTLVADGAVSIEPPEHSKIGSISVYNTDFEELDYHLTWEELHTLPTGEYIVVFSEATDTRNTATNYTTYWITFNDNIFRLIIA